MAQLRKARAPGSNEWRSPYSPVVSRNGGALVEPPARRFFDNSLAAMPVRQPTPKAVANTAIAVITSCPRQRRSRVAD